MNCMNWLRPFSNMAAAAAGVVGVGRTGIGVTTTALPPPEAAPGGRSSFAGFAAGDVDCGGDCGGGADAAVFAVAAAAVAGVVVKAGGAGRADDDDDDVGDGDVRVEPGSSGWWASTMRPFRVLPPSRTLLIYVFI